MFILKTRILRGRNTIGFEVENSNTGVINFYTYGEVYDMALLKRIQNVEVAGKSLKGLNRFNLSKLPKRQYDSYSRFPSNVLVGDDLSKIISIAKGFKHRFIFNDLYKFLSTPYTSPKICILYGVRRTGKSVMMAQAIEKLLNAGVSKNVVAYVDVKATGTVAELYTWLDTFLRNGIKYVFLDEISLLSGFIQTSAVLADVYAMRGIKLVIAGTDSLSLEMAGKSSLYDRYVAISTTSIRYKEYSYLTGDTDILNYLKSGGVLPADLFYTGNKVSGYIKTSITDNIKNSVEKANNYREHALIVELINKGLLNKVVEEAVGNYSIDSMADTISTIYRNGSLGSAMQLVGSYFNIDELLPEEDIVDNIRYSLRILMRTNDKFVDKYMEDVLYLLEKMEVLRKTVKVKNYDRKETYLVNQLGICYAQSLEVLRALGNSKEYKQMPREYRRMLSSKILEDLEGHLLENEILLSTLDKYENVDNVKVCQYNSDSREIDMVLRVGNDIHLFEVKRSKNKVKNQCRHLLNGNFIAEIENYFDGDVKSRNVLYMGEDAKMKEGDITIYYRNIEKFLLEF